MASQSVDVLIIGAGPTGLGAAKRLHQLKHSNFLIVDAASEAGGLASTDTTPEGFLFDVGGSVSTTPFLLGRAISAPPSEHELGLSSDDWYEHERVSYVRSKGAWVPYPYQVSHGSSCSLQKTHTEASPSIEQYSMLPVEEQVKCIEGMIDAARSDQDLSTSPRRFDEWIIRMMVSVWPTSSCVLQLQGLGHAYDRGEEGRLGVRGTGYSIQLLSYLQMQCEWLGERVAAPSLKLVVSNVLNKKTAGNCSRLATVPEVSGKPSQRRCLKSAFPFNKTVVRIEGANKVAHLSDGSSVAYRSLILHHALDEMVELCWLYFDRLLNYSPYNCPQPEVKIRTIQTADPSLSGSVDTKSERAGPYWSLMLEVSQSSQKPVDEENLIRTASRHDQHRSPATVGTRSSRLPRKFHHGYPTPSLSRDGQLKTLLPRTPRQVRIWSRGRFGSYKYEVANQDHSFMIGVEAVDGFCSVHQR
ncbi:BQ5605_C024g09946 [Microbotryum silenes-dioicae]|uniref:BQ5605_C024g09946 protein n=1 Tax=Microbotryum silenes-dioicae TaxID=796604 RepID=A0A2X0PFP3_9BASI|nr:BQ5605_C024g09946 [Microbotryum silenes-dioicae]